MSSKKPVPRARPIIEAQKVKSRDPRFSVSAGSLSTEPFQKNYAFLADMRESELDTLKENLKRAKRMHRSSPRDQREEREAEVERLERAVKRLEGLVNRDMKESIERETLENARREEKRKRHEGKGEWYMKNSEKKELLLHARYDALAKKGGQFAVRRAIEKKQKKISQKEKKRAPLVTGTPFRSQVPDSDGSGAQNKKRRLDQRYWGSPEA